MKVEMRKCEWHVWPAAVRPSAGGMANACDRTAWRGAHAAYQVVLQWLARSKVLRSFLDNTGARPFSTAGFCGDPRKEEGAARSDGDPLLSGAAPLYLGRSPYFRKCAMAISTNAMAKATSIPGHWLRGWW